jgi:hypothetical protein
MPANNRAGGVVLGLLSALAISFSLSYTGSHSRERKVQRQNIFAKDRTISSLGRALPQLVLQFRRCGLHPVFVVDELDKVKDLPRQMRLLVSYLKDFASDRTLFCFLTDRDYLEYIEQRTAGNTYVAEYSYFRDRIPVFYQPDDLRGYLNSIFTASDSTGTSGPSSDHEVLAYSLLHRARLHPLDLSRELAGLSDENGFVRIPVQELREGPRTIELLLQLAVERVLAGPDLQDGVRTSARFAQLVIDALYYPSRSWAKGDPFLDTKDDAIIKYLEGRMNPAQDDDDDAKDQASSKSKEKPPEHNGLSARDKDILLLAVRRVAFALEDPDGLVAYIKQTRLPGQGPSDAVLDLTPRGERLKLLQKVETDKYEWRFNAYGLPREASDINAVTEGTRDDRAFLNWISQSVLKWTEGPDLGRIAVETGLPVLTPQWSTVRLAIDRIDRLDRGEISAYPEMTADKLTIEEYAARLRPRTTVLSQTLICAWSLASDSDRPTQSEKFLHALRVLVSIKGVSEDPVGRMGEIYRTLRETVPALKERPGLDAGEGEWALWTDQMIASAKSPLPFDMQQRVWTRWFGRFHAYFQQGTTTFETAFEDLWTRIKSPIMPSVLPADLRPRLSDVTLSGWGNMLLDSKAGLTPAWFTLPAAVLPGLSRLAGRIVTTGPGLLNTPNDQQYEDWVRNVRSMRDTRRVSLLIAADVQSLASAWTVSATYPVLSISAARLADLANWLTVYGVTKPQEIGIDRLLFELVGDAVTLASRLKNPPSSNFPGTNLLPLAQLMLSLPCTYLLSDSPAETTDKPLYPYVVAPATLDDLMSKPSSRP